MLQCDLIINDSFDYKELREFLYNNFKSDISYYLEFKLVVNKNEIYFDDYSVEIQNIEDEEKLLYFYKCIIYRISRYRSIDNERFLLRIYVY